MRRLTGIELGILVLAGLFIFAGIDMVVDPAEMNVVHQSYRWVHSSVDHISKRGSQIYGGVIFIELNRFAESRGGH